LPLVRAVGAADPHPKAVVLGKALALKIGEEAAAQEAVIPGEHTPHLVEEELARDAAPGGEALGEAELEGGEILAGIEAHPEQPRTTPVRSETARREPCASGRGPWWADSCSIR
jgi:hypothetical protein